MEKPELSDYLFWDTDKSVIDWQRQADAVIVRVLERGDLAEFREIRRFYGDDKIKDAALKAKYLSAQTLSFTSFFFNLPKIEFECYKNRHYQLPHLTF